MDVCAASAPPTVATESPAPGEPLPSLSPTNPPTNMLPVCRGAGTPPPPRRLDLLLHAELASAGLDRFHHPLLGHRRSLRRGRARIETERRDGASGTDGSWTPQGLDEAEPPAVRSIGEWGDDRATQRQRDPPRARASRGDAPPTPSAGREGEGGHAGSKSVAAALAVSDLGRARTFYEGTLGLQPMQEDPGSILYRSGTSVVLVYTSEYAGTNRPTAAAWAVGDDFGHAIVEGLRAKGVAFERYDDLPDVVREGDVHLMGDFKGVWLKDPTATS